MKRFLKGGFLAAFLFITSAFSLENVILNENNILNEQVTNKINAIGKELYDKTSIFVALAVGDTSDLKSLEVKAKELTAPYVLLMLSKSEHKVDIIASKETLSFFDKEAVLSPYSGTGSILPILTSNKGKDIYNAALLNGYADISDQIASYFNLKLENSIGNANKDTLNILRIGIYGFICFALLFYFQRKITRKRRNNNV